MHGMQHSRIIDKHFHLGIRSLLHDRIKHFPWRVHRRQVHTYRQEIQFRELFLHIIPNGIGLILKKSHNDDIVASFRKKPHIFQPHSGRASGN